MSSRRLFREYAQSKGKIAESFVEIKPEFYANDTLITKDSQGNLESTTIDYREMVHWITRTKKLTDK